MLNKNRKYSHLTSRTICWLLPFPMELPTSHMYSPDCDLVEGGGEFLGTRIPKVINSLNTHWKVRGVLRNPLAKGNKLFGHTLEAGD